MIKTGAEGDWLILDMLAHHYPEYLIEAALLGIFMVCACTAVVVVNHPASPVARTITSPLRRRMVLGVLMGLVAIALIHSPWGQRSGAHMNPGVTLTFVALGKLGPVHGVCYIVAQFIGGLLGVWFGKLVLGKAIAHVHVNHAATTPGTRGVRVAWLAEFGIAFVLMSMVLWTSNSVNTAAYTGLFAGLLVAVFIAVEAPLSGMSMNPARTLASALPSRTYRGLWVYFTAPPVAMLCAAGLYVSVRGTEHVYCGKLDHRSCEKGTACIFECRVREMNQQNRETRMLSEHPSASDDRHEQ